MTHPFLLHVPPLLRRSAVLALVLLPGGCAVYTPYPGYGYPAYSGGYYAPPPPVVGGVYVGGGWGWGWRRGRWR